MNDQIAFLRVGEGARLIRKYRTRDAPGMVELERIEAKELSPLVAVDPAALVEFEHKTGLVGDIAFELVCSVARLGIPWRAVKQQAEDDYAFSEVNDPHLSLALSALCDLHIYEKNRDIPVLLRAARQTERLKVYAEDAEKQKGGWEHRPAYTALAVLYRPGMRPADIYEAVRRALEIYGKTHPGIIMPEKVPFTKKFNRWAYRVG